MTGNIILKGSTSDDMTNANIHPRLMFTNLENSQAVSFIFTDYDTYRAPAGIKLVGNQGDEWFEAPKLIKTGSSDSYVLLGGGGHKAVSTFTPSLVTSTTSTGITNVATTNTNTYLNIVQGGASAGSSTQVTGTGSVTVSSDASGKLTINGVNNYLPLTGGTLTGQLILNGLVSGDYNNGIRINRDSANWSSLMFGGPVGQTAGHNGTTNWFVAANPNSVFMINPINSSAGYGLDLYRNGEVKWRGNTI